MRNSLKNLDMRWCKIICHNLSFTNVVFYNSLMSDCHQKMIWFSSWTNMNVTGPSKTRQRLKRCPISRHFSKKFFRVLIFPLSRVYVFELTEKAIIFKILILMSVKEIRFSNFLKGLIKTKSIFFSHETSLIFQCFNNLI